MQSITVCVQYLSLAQLTVQCRCRVWINPLQTLFDRSLTIMPDVSSPHQYLVFRLGRVYLPPSCHSVHSQCQCRVHLLSPTETQIDSCLTSPSPSLVSVSLGSRPFHPPWPPVCSPASIVKASDDDVMRKHCLEESGTESYY